MVTSIAIADDHPVVLRGLAGLIGTAKGFSVVAVALNGNDLLAVIRDRTPDIAIVDLNMPDLSGLQIIAAMRREKLSSRVVLLTAAASDAQLYDAMALGVSGIVLKDAASDKIIECLRCVAAGGQWLSEEVLRPAMQLEFERREKWRTLSRELTFREREIVQFVCEGASNREIADKFGISEGTAKVHLNNIYRKLEVSSRVELAKLAASQREYP